MKPIKALLCLLLGLLLLTACEKNAAPPAVSTEPPHVHAYESHVVAPTCTDVGYTHHVCACGDSYSDNQLPPLSHQYNTTAPDVHCNQYVYQIYICELCGHQNSEPTEQKGSIHDLKTTVVYPTKETGGYTLHACSRCDYSYTDSHTDPVNHSTGLAYEKRSNGWFVVGIGTCG
ncbi:MAG: hypothetical protein E7620_07125, partial [Ruminococcaceae bacterium]|nr:hypothetical protein [Oscillospiraceae bacterium]